MADYTDLNVYHDVGPVLETTSRVSLPVVGATNRFTTSVSRDGDAVNNAVVTLQVFDSDTILVYPANNTLRFASITVDEAGRFTGGTLSGSFGNRGTGYLMGEQVTIVQELGGANTTGGSNAVIAITGVFDAANNVLTAAGSQGPVAWFSIVSAGLLYKPGPASGRLTATTVVVPRDLSINGFYSLVPERTNIFTKSGYQYKIQWNIFVPADAKFPVCVYPRTQYVVASDS
jgi:hypothetical protein